MRKTFLIVFVFGIVKYTQSQYFTIGSNRKTSKSTCDTSTKSTLIEHFFNIIFTEFHNTPPVCVCVQMCLDQPTYCYPNGCLKRAETNKKSEVPLPVTRLSDSTKPIFFIDEKTDFKNDFMNDFLTKNYVDVEDNLPKLNQMPAQSVTSRITNMRPDPFKDRYKILFKYKKMPKVELKYNLGEQVKNMKSEVLKNEHVDVSKTRWPMNKYDRRLNVGQRSVQNTPQKSTNNRYFRPVSTDKDPNYSPKYFKRELQNNTNTDVDIKAIYVVGKSETDSSTFSLEKLIDSLIESSIDKNATSSDAGAETKVNQTKVHIEELNDTTVNDNSSKRLMRNETTNIISMNLTNENVDKNKYSDDIMTNKSNNVSDMIATLSKSIEIQNNTSLEIMKRITGDFEYESSNTTSEKSIKTKLHTENEISTTEYTTLPIVYETRTTRKIRKRLVRRLQNSKNNK